MSHSQSKPTPLTGLHIIFSYQCNFECDHCFVWGSPRQTGTLTLDQIEIVLDQALELGTVREIYLEGGEPFLYYASLVKTVEMAHAKGFQVGVVTNAYWALSYADALEWLHPLTGKLSDLSVSSDLFHYDQTLSRQAQFASAAAHHLNIPTGTICIAQPEQSGAQDSFGVIPTTPTEQGSAVMYRGRAAIQLAPKYSCHPWETFHECPHEDLHSPGRVHLDPLGNLHICQGIRIGNLFEASLQNIWADFDDQNHPIIGPLLTGGPAELARRYNISPPTLVADACHLCYLTRLALRDRFPEILGPDQMYGVF